MTKLQARCCIAGGGPAGMMLGFLLARAGIDVVVLEKHADFLRDFRGDTVHPSTLELMHELGLLDEFLKRPHTKFDQLTGNVGGHIVTVADFRYLNSTCKFIVLMPQWDFLSFLAETGRRYATFRVLMSTEVTGLLENDRTVVGVRTTGPDGPIEIQADLVVGADGRHSTVRERAGFVVDDFGAPIDVLWMKLPKHPGDPDAAAGNFNAGRILVALDRGDYWQCAYVIRKGGFEAVKARGLQALRDDIVAVAPLMRDRVDALQAWNQVSLLTVTIDRLRQWYKPGLLCIGDAAHAMSPIGGVGINLAIQDAVATANILYPPLRTGRPSLRELAQVQRRRTFPTKATQGLQVFIQDRVISRALQSAQSTTTTQVPFAARLFSIFPFLRWLPARFVGIGFRPEHVHTPDASAAPSA